MPRSKNILKVVISWLFVTMMVVSSLHAAPHSQIVRKAIPVEQVQTSAKVVSGDGTQTALVVLPPGFEKREVVVADSQEYKDILSQNKVLQQQVKNDEVRIASFDKITEKVQQDQAAAIVAEQKRSSSLCSKLHWISWLGGGSLILGAAALIALCVFCPAAIPLVERWLVSVVSALFTVLKDLAEDLAKLIPKKTTSVASKS